MWLCTCDLSGSLSFDPFLFLSSSLFFSFLLSFFLSFFLSLPFFAFVVFLLPFSLVFFGSLFSSFSFLFSFSLSSPSSFLFLLLPLLLLPLLLLLLLLLLPVPSPSLPFSSCLLLPSLPSFFPLPLLSSSCPVSFPFFASSPPGFFFFFFSLFWNLHLSRVLKVSNRVLSHFDFYKAMDRSRSPHRATSNAAGARPLVWSRPNAPDNLPRGQGLQPGQLNSCQWTQGHHGFQPSQGTPLSQGSQHIPPGQIGGSQQSCGFSQQPGSNVNNQNWGQSQSNPVAPRPPVHGIGLGGVLPTFPPTPPTWTSSQFPGNLRPPQHGYGTPPLQRPTQVSTPSGSTHGKTQMGRIPNIPMGQYWQPDEEHYDIKKLNGLTLPRTIRASSWTQLKDIEGCDPLTVPLSKSLYQGSANYWLRKLATGREVYVATMGEVSQVVFVSSILSQLRSRGIDLDKLAQHKALQDGQALEKKEAIQSLAKLVGDQLQRWYPTIQADPSSQHKIADCRVGSQDCHSSSTSNQPPAPSSQVPHPEGQAPPARVQSPIEAAFQGQRPAAFDPAQLLVSPGSNNQWLESNMIDSLSDAKYKTWFRNLKLDNPTRQTIERSIVAVDSWWQNQPEEAEATIHRVAVCPGIPPAKIKSGQNENLLKVLTVALTMTA